MESHFLYEVEALKFRLALLIMHQNILHIPVQSSAYQSLNISGRIWRVNKFSSQAPNHEIHINVHII